MVHRQAEIYYKERLAGLLSEVDSGYEFVYLPQYLAMEGARAVSSRAKRQEIEDKGR